MENASKALLIAAAIIIAIVLVSLGVYVVGSTSGFIKGANLNPQEVMAFNSKFTSYEGTQNGSTVKSLINDVRNYNNSVDEDYINIVISESADQDGKQDGSVEFLSEADYNSKLVGKYPTVSSGYKYLVKFDTAKSGKISKITIRRIQ